MRIGVGEVVRQRGLKVISCTTGTSAFTTLREVASSNVRRRRIRTYSRPAARLRAVCLIELTRAPLNGLQFCSARGQRRDRSHSVAMESNTVQVHIAYAVPVKVLHHAWPIAAAWITRRYQDTST